MPLLESYTIRIEVFKCSPQSEEAGCLVDLAQDIGAVMPYINASIRSCRFNPEGPTLELEHDGRRFALHSKRVAFGGVVSSLDAELAMRSMQQLINDTWDSRERITPSQRKGPTLSPLSIFQLLPGVNCGACGEPTCLAFAAKVAREKLSIGQCSSLGRPQHAHKRQKVAGLLLDAGYDAPEGWR